MDLRDLSIFVLNRINFAVEFRKLLLRNRIFAIGFWPSRSHMGTCYGVG